VGMSPHSQVVSQSGQLVSQIERSVAELCHSFKMQTEHHWRSTNCRTVSQFGELRHKLSARGNTPCAGRSGGADGAAAAG